MGGSNINTADAIIALCHWQDIMVHSSAQTGVSRKAGLHSGAARASRLIEGVVFAGSMDGHLRAYGMANGKIIRDSRLTKNDHLPFVVESVPPGAAHRV